MFGNSYVSSGLSLTKVLGGISKTLSIANQVIPLYREAKPMINNAKTILNVLKGLNTKTSTQNPVSKTATSKSNYTYQAPPTPTLNKTNNPTFFA